MDWKESRLVNRLLPALAVVGTVGLVGALGMAQEGGSRLAQREETAGHKFKNIKLLKNLPANQLIPLMEGINASLGVRCDFCHVINADHTGFELDTKPMKNMARKMIVLVNDLNAHQKILDRKATCYMCHHGHPEPESRPPMEERRPGR